MNEIDSCITMLNYEYKNNSEKRKYILKFILNENCDDHEYEKSKELLKKSGFYYIFIKMSEKGKLSRILNTYLTPVYDKDLGATGLG